MDAERKWLRKSYRWAIPVNICRTARLSGPWYSLSITQDSLNDIANDVERNVRRDLDASDRSRQNEMNGSIADLLIMMEGRQNRLAVYAGQCRQSANRSNCRLDARSIRLREFLKVHSDAGGRDHSITHSLSVFDSLVSRCGFQSVSDRMAEIEDSPQVALFFVGHHDVRLDCGTCCNKALDGCRIAIPEQRGILFEILEQRRITNDAVLERFEKTAGVLPVRQRFQKERIGKDEPRLMKRADEIFRDAVVHTGLAADTGIHLGEESCWYLNHGDAAHVQRRDESCHVAHDAAAQGNHSGLASEIELDQTIEKPRNCCQRLGALSVGNQNNGKLLAQPFSQGFENPRLRDDKEWLTKSGCLEVFFQVLEDSCPNDDFVGGIRQSNFYGLHGGRGNKSAANGANYANGRIKDFLCAHSRNSRHWRLVYFLTYFFSASCRRALLARSLASGIRSTALTT